MTGPKTIPHRPDYVLVPIAVRESETVRLHFPADITAEEAAKVARVIQAYATEPRSPKSSAAR